MEYIQISKFRANLAECVNKTVYGSERFIIERAGKPLFAIIPVEDMRLLEGLYKNQKRKS